MTAAAFAGFTGFTLVMPFLPLYFRQLGVGDDADIALWSGVTLGVTPAITALAAPFWGRVGDRFGNKILVQRSLVAFVLVMIAMAYATRAWHLFALRALQGFVGGYGPLTLSMAALSAPPERMAQAIGAVQTAQRLGPALGPVIGGILAPLVGLRNAFLVASGFYAVAFMVVTILYQEPRPAARRPDHARPTLASILTVENLLLLMAVVFGLQLVDRSFGPVLPLYLGQLGFGAEEVPLRSGIVFSAMAFAGAFGNQLAGRLLARTSPRLVIATAALAGAAALGAFALITAFWGLVACTAIVGLCIGTSLTTAFTVAGAVIPREVHSTAFGFLTGAALIGVAVSPVLSGLVAARSIVVVFVAGAAVFVVLSLVVRRVMVERPLIVERAPTVDEG